MKRISLIVFIAALPATVLFASSAAAGEQHPSTLSSSSLSIHYNEGLIDAYVDNATLRDVLHKLAAHTGAHIILSDPATASQRVSVVVKSMPFESGIKRILDGFSYAFYLVAGVALPGVIILSTPAVQQENGSEPVADGGEDGDPTAYVVKEKEPRELPTQRAVEALKSNHSPLQGEAIYALVSSRDPGTMEDLVEATSASGTMDLESQVLALEVLRTYAADQAFADKVAINALVQLIQRGNEAVSNVAR
jgi:hypothetical protein